MTSVTQQFDAKPAWRALFALVIGFFMILIDTTIVSVAMPRIITELDTTLSSAIWVTSAYLLAYAVPLLITGRLGDRIGPKRLYQAGLVVFTLSSLACGLSGNITGLILARIVQGLGAAMMTPQTMAVITRLFPPKERAQAMAVWGATAGIAMLAGPLLGGLLTDTLGWEWIFYVNIPVGVIGLIAAARFVPRLPIHSHRFDILGVISSAIAMFLLVFGIQEGSTYHWGTITDNLSILGWQTRLPITVPALIVAGVVVMVLFIIWQGINKREPLVPLSLFTDRNFSAANVGITIMGFCATSMTIPLMMVFQLVRGMSPTESALAMIPMAVLSMATAPLMGRLTTRIDPKWIAIVGFATFALALFWLTSTMNPATPLWQIMVPLGLIGATNSCIWGPLSLTATRNLPPEMAGAGSGVYNTTRQLGSVLGSASIAAIMTSRVSVHFTDAVAQLPSAARAQVPTNVDGSGISQLPSFLHLPFGQAMADALLLPAAVVILGALAAVFFSKPPPEHMHN